ncbi:cyclophilin-like fold protein [Isoptericola sp. AK164]|uniref:cyclophilin-like fold protein n=1 Tax=Isoptericola sp. AK164 TaxID=3024246 RepID=UPI002418AC18|nr:cyclophilin-like fold protein [Isoptericola sp. AK164]
MTIRLTVAGRDLTATPADGAAARDFLALLPLTLTLDDFHGIEKVADLPSRLSTAGEPDGTTGNAGDLMYYAPWGNLAIFYRDFGHAPGLVRLGAFDDADAAAVLGALDGPTEVTISVVD